MKFIFFKRYFRFTAIVSKKNERISVFPSPYFFPQLDPPFSDSASPAATRGFSLEGKEPKTGRNPGDQSASEHTENSSSQTTTCIIV